MRKGVHGLAITDPPALAHSEAKDGSKLAPKGMAAVTDMPSLSIGAVSHAVIKSSFKIRLAWDDQQTKAELIRVRTIVAASALASRTGHRPPIKAVSYMVYHAYNAVSSAAMTLNSEAKS